MHNVSPYKAIEGRYHHFHFRDEEIESTVSIAQKQERKSRMKKGNWSLRMATASLDLAMAFIIQNRRLVTLSSEYFISVFS
jgi:hypothetical protein